MLNMKRFGMILIGLFVMTALSAAAQWDRPAWGGAGGLDLSEAQWNKIREIQLDFQKKMMDVQSRMRSLYLELDDLEWKGEQPSKMEPVLKNLDKAEMEMDGLVEGYWTSVRNILTKEQQTLFDDAGGWWPGLGPDCWPGGGTTAPAGRGAGLRTSGPLRRGTGRRRSLPGGRRRGPSRGAC